jgi:hypothetical protein
MTKEHRTILAELRAERAERRVQELEAELRSVEGERDGLTRAFDDDEQTLLADRDRLRSVVERARDNPRDPLLPDLARAALESEETMTPNHDTREWVLGISAETEREEILDGPRVDPAVTVIPKAEAERRVRELEGELRSIRTAGLYGTGPPTDEELERAAWSLCSHFAEPGAEVVFDAPGDSPAWRAIARAALKAARKR